MKNINKSTVMGRITHDVVLNKTNSGGTVVNFGIATNYKYKNKEGKIVDEVEYHDVTAWGRVAERVAHWCEVGTLVYVEGRMQTEKWEGQDGSMRRKKIIAARDVNIIDRPKQRSVDVVEELTAVTA